MAPSFRADRSARGWSLRRPPPLRCPVLRRRVSRCGARRPCGTRRSGGGESCGARRPSSPGLAAPVAGNPAVPVVPGPLVGAPDAAASSEQPGGVAPAAPIGAPEVPAPAGPADDLIARTTELLNSATALATSSNQGLTLSPSGLAISASAVLRSAEAVVRAALALTVQAPPVTVRAVQAAASPGSAPAAPAVTPTRASTPAFASARVTGVPTAPPAAMARVEGGPDSAPAQGMAAAPTRAPVPRRTPRRPLPSRPRNPPPRRRPRTTRRTRPPDPSHRRRAERNRTLQPRPARGLRDERCGEVRLGQAQPDRRLRRQPRQVVGRLRRPGSRRQGQADARRGERQGRRPDDHR